MSDLNNQIDKTGRKHMVRNVLGGWAGQFIFMIAGFIMPRMIDRHLGQNLLGVWDFAWSLVSYFSLVQVGIVAAINRFVAMYHGKNDSEGINRVASSVSCLLILMGSVILVLTVAACCALSYLRRDAIGQYITEARWVVLLLGFEMAVQTVFSIYSAVTTGCHRWGIYNGINAASYFVTVVGMFVVLVAGGGLTALAVTHFAGEMAANPIRWIAAHRVCPTLKIRLATADRQTMSAMFKFGAKAWAPLIGDMILNQTTSILLAASLGPAYLAVYSRSRSLTKYIRDLVMKMAGPLMASASSLHASGDSKQIQHLVIKSTRYAAFLSFPIGALLVVCGGPILEIWMGPRYAMPWVAAMLALGQTAAVVQLSVQAILAGMNRHGILSAANVTGSIIGVAAVACVVFWLKGGLFAVAAATTLPLLAVNLFYGPVHVCHCIGLPVAEYYKRAVLYPFVCMLPFAACLIAARWLLGTHIKLSVLIGALAGGAVLVPIYWRNVVPQSLKSSITKKLLKRNREPGPAIELSLNSPCIVPPAAAAEASGGPVNSSGD